MKRAWMVLGFATAAVLLGAGSGEAQTATFAWTCTAPPLLVCTFAPTFTCPRRAFPVACFWDFGDGTSFTGPCNVVTHVYPPPPPPPPYVVTFEVRCSNGTSAAVTQLVP